MAIQFGTSEWRAVIADEFTLADPQSMTGAIRSHFGSKKATNDSMLVGYDTRFLTSVGFKYIGELINENKIVIGGEESAGLSIKGHYSAKDGILARVLTAEAVAARGASLTRALPDKSNKIQKRLAAGGLIVPIVSTE